MKRFIALSTLIGLCLFQGSAFAVLTGVTVSPPSATLAVNRPGSVSLTWAVDASPVNNGSSTVTSSQVLITSATRDAAIIGTIPRTLSRSITPGGSILISETVVIPRSIIQAMSRARDADGNPVTVFLLVRNFTDNSVDTLTAAVNLYLTGGSGSLLQIDRTALTFDDLTTVRVLPRGDRLNAQVDIRYSGSGMLRGVWELATPASTLGEPVYTNLGLVRQTLVGNQSLRLQSPDLPTDLEGAYLLRFRITEPETGFEPVTIRYLVTKPDLTQRPPLNITPLTPGNGALLGADTRFSWRGDEEAKAWQLEVYAKPPNSFMDQLPDLDSNARTPAAAREVEGPPVTGMMLPGGSQETTLSKLARGHLKPGQGYWWRVRALDRDGQVIGESPLVEFRTP
jgi:hypothetical protein